MAHVQNNIWHQDKVTCVLEITQYKMLKMLQKFGNTKGLHNKHYLVIRIMNIYEATYICDSTTTLVKQLAQKLYTFHKKTNNNLVLEITIK